MNSVWQPLSMGHRDTQFAGIERVTNQVVCTKAVFNSITHKEANTIYFVKP